MTDGTTFIEGQHDCHTNRRRKNKLVCAGNEHFNLQLTSGLCFYADKAYQQSCDRVKLLKSAVSTHFGPEIRQSKDTKR